MAEIYQAIIGVMSDIGVIGKEKENAQQVWNEQYKQDAGDIVKMNEALIELNEKLRRIEEMKNDA